MSPDPVEAINVLGLLELEVPSETLEKHDGRGQIVSQLQRDEHAINPGVRTRRERHNSKRYRTRYNGVKYRRQLLVHSSCVSDTAEQNGLVNNHLITTAIPYSELTAAPQSHCALDDRLVETGGSSDYRSSHVLRRLQKPRHDTAVEFTDPAGITFEVEKSALLNGDIVHVVNVRH